MGRSDTIKSYSSFILLPSLLPLLQIDAFLLTFWFLVVLELVVQFDLQVGVVRYASTCPK